MPEKVSLPAIFSPLVDDGEINSEISIYQKSATQELAIATSNPEVKGATATAKSVVKPAAKNNNFLRDWLIPRLGYGLLVAVVFALIIIKFKKLRKLKE